MKIIPGWRSSNYLARFGIFLTIAALVAGMAGCIPFPQNLEIRTWYDLNAIRDNLNDNHILMKDLDSTTAGYEELASPAANGGMGWQPIGTDDGPFTGTFDGQEYEIRDLFIYRPDESGVGLFGAVEQSGVIENIGVTNATVIGRNNFGGLVGVNWGTVTNSYSTGSVIGVDDVGGLVGINIGTVSNSYSSSNVTSNGEFIGGLVGVSEGTVTNSYSTGNVTGNLGVGGLVGANGYRTPGTVSHSYSTGSVNGESFVGGLVGGNSDQATVSHSYSTGNVTGEAYVGGLVGWSDDDIVSNSYYNYDDVFINGKNIITSGALFGEDFDQWLAEGKFLDVNERLSQESGYYVISNVNDFKQLLAFGQDSSLKFRLKNDLDLTTEPNFYIPRLAGEFDGNGHRISNLSFNFDFISQVGLFGRLTYGAVVTHVGAESANITGDEDVGGLVGENYGAVRNSYATGIVTGDKNVGGLVGHNSHWATVRNSYATSNVTGDENVGGLVGYNSHQTTVSLSYSTGNVTGDNDVGGLVGWSLGLVGYSFWNTETSGQATSDGGTGKNTTEMQYIITFSGEAWDIIAVANPGMRNPSYIWNIVNNVTYPFLSWQS